MLSGFIVMNKICARPFFSSFFRSFSQLERERGRKRKIGFVVELFMLMRGANLEQAI